MQQHCPLVALAEGSWAREPGPQSQRCPRAVPTPTLRLTGEGHHTGGLGNQVYFWPFYQNVKK